MPLVEAKCTNCGGILQVDNSKEAAICPFCNSAYIVEKAIKNYYGNITGTIKADVVNIYNSTDPNPSSPNPNPLSAEYTNKYQALVNVGEYRMAMVVLKEAIENNPEDAELYRSMLKTMIISQKDEEENLIGSEDYEIHYLLYLSKYRILNKNVPIGEDIAPDYGGRDVDNLSQRSIMVMKKPCENGYGVEYRFLIGNAQWSLIDRTGTDEDNTDLWSYKEDFVPMKDNTIVRNVYDLPKFNHDISEGFRLGKLINFYIAFIYDKGIRKNRTVNSWGTDTYICLFAYKNKAYYVRGGDEINRREVNRKYKGFTILNVLIADMGENIDENMIADLQKKEVPIIEHQIQAGKCIFCDGDLDFSSKICKNCHKPAPVLDEYGTYKIY